MKQRKVTEEQGRQLADELKLPYIETSAKDPPINVDAAFHELVRIVRSFPVDEDDSEVVAGIRSISRNAYFQSATPEANTSSTVTKQKKAKQKCSVM